MRMDVFSCMHVFLAHRDLKRALAKDSEPLSRWWELDPSPLKGQPVFFNAEP